MEFITTGMDVWWTGSEGFHCLTCRMERVPGEIWKPCPCLSHFCVHIIMTSIEASAAGRDWKPPFWPLGTILPGFVLRAGVKWECLQGSLPVHRWLWPKILAWALGAGQRVLPRAVMQWAQMCLLLTVHYRHSQLFHWNEGEVRARGSA